MHSDGAIINAGEQWNQEGSGRGMFGERARREPEFQTIIQAWRASSNWDGEVNKGLGGASLTTLF